MFRITPSRHVLCVFRINIQVKIQLGEKVSPEYLRHLTDVQVPVRRDAICRTLNLAYPNQCYMRTGIILICMMQLRLHIRLHHERTSSYSLLGWLWRQVYSLLWELHEVVLTTMMCLLLICTKAFSSPWLALVALAATKHPWILFSLPSNLVTIFLYMCSFILMLIPITWFFYVKVSTKGVNIP